MRKEKSKGCCNNKVVITSLCSIVMLIALALNSYATSCAFVAPSNNGYLTIGSTLNFTVDELGTSVNAVVIHINASSSSTANSSVASRWLSFGNVSGSGMVSGAMNMSVNETATLVIEPSNDYTLTASIENATGASGQIACNATRTGITIDLGDVPSTPTSVSPTGTLTSKDQTITSTVNGANTTQCTLTFIGKNLGYVNYGMTHSGNTCELAFTNIPEATYTYTITASDGTNTSISGENTMTVDIRTSTAKKAYVISGGQLPTQASATAQQRAGGQQAVNALDRAIAKAPPEAQVGLTKAKEAVTNQYKGVEAIKTWSGTTVGCVTGFFIVPVIGLIPGCITGHLIGAIV